VPERHADLRQRPPIDECYERAAVGLLWNDDRSELRAFHQAGITRQVAAVCIVALPARLVAGNSPSFKDRNDIFLVTHLSALSACLTNRHERRRTRHCKATDKYGHKGQSAFLQEPLRQRFIWKASIKIWKASIKS
jgi:hypothetical protein